MLYESIKHIYPNIKDNEFSLQDNSDGNGAFVSRWDYSEPQPTQAQIDSVMQEVKNKLITERLEAALDSHIDSEVKKLGYLSLDRLVGVYSNSENPKWKAEALGAAKWNTAIWRTSLMIINEVRQGRPIPSEEELLSEMPKLVDFVIY